MKKCVTCGIEKEDDAFNWRYKYKNERHVICRDCQHGHAKKWYEGHKEEHQANVYARTDKMRETAYHYVYEYLKQHPCIECGEADPTVLEFHHLRSKDRSVSQMIRDNKPLDQIKEEIEKCVVLCANCHRRKTAKERGFFRGK